ncbi:putative mechanosensitive ion channel [Handroanthus impetiginosus]|uniref:Mechanosensitive ion channel protein n=1 Tax=Handroanthus impetiginosus TaxID=429701 RepID=A0A2G9I7U3_9LAMI|nr:putative mechanosensitive ion channel [Handroanthus impetiginosus]
MDFSSSIKKSFKSHNSYKHGRLISIGNVPEEDDLHEKQPILSDHNRADHPMSERSEVIVKIDGSDPPAAASNGNRGLDFEEDPPAKLIGQFLNKQKAAGRELSLDVDMEMDEFRHNHNYNDRGQSDQSFPNSKELKLSSGAPHCSGNMVDIELDEQEKSYQKSHSSSDDDENQRIYNRKRSPNVDLRNESQVLRCTSIQTRFSSFARMKTKSRLMDLPEVPDTISGMTKSGQLRSGMLGRASGMLAKTGEEEEEDPLFAEDLPDEYKDEKFDAITMLQWMSLVLILTSLVCTLAIPKWKSKKLRGLSLWKWEVLVLVLICGRLVSGWGIRIVVFFIERNFFMRKRILYFVYGVRKAVQNCIWLGLVLLAWKYMFHKKVEKSNKFLWYVNKLMVCMLVGTLLWLVKTLMVKVLASSFHVSTFFDRIQESLFNQYVIETLSGAPLIEIKTQQEEEEKIISQFWRLDNKSGDLGSKVGKEVKKSDQDEGIEIPIDKLHKLNHKNVSAWNIQRLIKVVMKGVLTTLDERVLDSSQGDETTTQIRSEKEAILAARKIFRNVAKPSAKFIYIEDLTRFMQEEEALKTLHVVEGSAESGKISKTSLKNWMVNAFIERRALALTLNDTKTAVDKLHQMVNAIVGVIIVIICLVILGIATSKFLLYISSQIVVVAFIFGNTCKTIFEAVIFVFVIHPFDVGDRCEVDGVQMIVEEMNILTTIFLRYDNLKIIYPNSTLATKPISNLYRSPDMGDSVDFAIHIATPAEKIALIKQRITSIAWFIINNIFYGCHCSYIENRNDHWYPSPLIVLMNLEDLRTLKMSVWLRHRMNHQNIAEKWKRRALLVEEMVNIFKELDLEYRLYPLDINLRSMLPLGSSRTPPTWTIPLQLTD